MSNAILHRLEQLERITVDRPIWCSLYQRSPAEAPTVAHDLQISLEAAQISIAIAHRHPKPDPARPFEAWTTSEVLQVLELLEAAPTESL